MLVINRREGEDIDIKDHEGNLIMVIRLIRTHGKQAKIGFMGPRAVVIERQERLRTTREDMALLKHWDMRKKPNQAE